MFAVIFLIGAAYLSTKGLRASRLLFLAIPVYFIVAISILCNAFSWNPSGITLTIEGLNKASFISARILLLIWASLAISLVANVNQISSALTSLLSPLSKLHVPVNDIAMICSIVLRFIPNVFERYLQIKNAQWARGAHFTDGSIFTRMKAHAQILPPLLVSLFTSADTLSQAMDARCYGMPNTAFTRLEISKLSRIQTVAAFLFAIITIFVCMVL